MNTQNSSHALIVLGMHRSGTSALAGVMSMLGIHPGNSLLPATEGVNPKGFWEHAEIVSIHDKLLETFDSSWDDESPLPDRWWLSNQSTEARDQIIKVLHRDFGNVPAWLIKDPRICRLMPLWHEVLREFPCRTQFVITLRNPAEVAHSLRKRNDLPEEASYLLWLTHMLEAELQTRGQPRIFVKYESLLSDWRRTVAAIGQNLNFTWPIAVEDAAAQIEDFLDASLRHHVSSASLPDHPACRLAQEGFTLLSATFPETAKLDQLRNQTEELVSIVSPCLGQSKKLNVELRTNVARLESENTLLHSEIKRVKSSISWQLTKPLRFLVWLARKIKTLFISHPDRNG